MSESKLRCIISGALLLLVGAPSGCTTAAAASETSSESDTGATKDGGSPDTTSPGDSWVNIVEVSASGSSGEYSFNVRFESSDIDCTQFADWWEVVTEDGTLLYRRILAHPHTPGLSGNPVMRSGGPVTVTADDVMIIRGHMNNAGYIGIPMRGSVTAGFTPAPDIDAQFAPTLEGADPQPAECIPEQDIVG